jgi:lipoprotein-releasing system permease protein
VNFPLYIARRYLVSKKKHNAINVISGISVCGVVLATLALVCTLSVFNGFQEMVGGLFTAFDPDIKITSREGKVFDSEEERIQTLRGMKEIEVFTLTLEDQAMVEYKSRKAMAMIKGVEDNFEQLTGIDSILLGNGSFMLHDPVVEYGIMGVELVSVLGTGIKFMDPLRVNAPRRNQRVNVTNPASSFNAAFLYSPGSVFVVSQPKYDSQYILTSLAFARSLFDYDKEVSAIELKLKPDVNAEAVIKQIKEVMGEGFTVSNRYEQQADIYRIMEVEKFISYIFLTFILVIACFNIIGSLSMLIIDKKEDVITLKNLGADNRLITTIFLVEGRLIILVGALGGIAIGLLLCFLQQQFGFITLGNNWESFIVDAYPVSVRATDILGIFVTVIIIGFISAWYPVKYLTKRILNRVQ